MSSICGQNARELLAALKSTTPDDEVDALIRALAEALQRASKNAASEALEILSAGLDVPDPERAGVASRVMGAMLEAGARPAPAREAMLSCLRGTFPLCVELADAAHETVGAPPDGLDDEATEQWLADRENSALQKIAAQRPELADAWQRLGAVWPGAIALFSVDPIARAQAHDLSPLAEELEGVHEAAGWVRAMLSVVHNEPFVAIEPATKTGIAGRMSGIVENFQLNVLLMDAFPGAEPRVSPAAVTVARGEGPQQTEEEVTGAWNLYTYAALQPGAELPDPSDHAFSETWIWNEGMPADIPELNEHRVILLGPAPYPRSWQAQRMFLKLPAGLEAEVLDEEAVAEWLGRIERATGES
jgi:hypothetical protein